MLQTTIAWIVPAITAITLREAAHGFMAQYLGDDTAKRSKRLTWEPSRHIDSIGTIIVPLLIGFWTPYLFGWAKALPTNAHRATRLSPMAAQLWILSAGTWASLALTISWSLFGRLLLIQHNTAPQILPLMIDMCRYGVVMNLSLLLIHLIPIPPCDGGYLLALILPQEIRTVWLQSHNYGAVVVMAMLMIHLLDRWLQPSIIWAWQWLGL